MPPSEFWACDTWTAMDAYEGYAQSKGIKVAEEGDKLTSEDIEELQQMMEAEEKRMAEMAGKQ